MENNFPFGIEIVLNLIIAVSRYLLKTRIFKTQSRFSIPLIDSRSLSKFVWKNLKHYVKYHRILILFNLVQSLFDWQKIIFYGHWVCLDYIRIELCHRMIPRFFGVIQRFWAIGVLKKINKNKYWPVHELRKD